MRWFKLLTIWLPRILLALLVFDVGYLVGIWPDWTRYKKDPIPASKFIEKYRKDVQGHPELPPLRWRPISINKLPEHLLRAVIVSEDARFYSHSGFDPDAFLDAMEYNLTKKRVVYGGSTISQQTVKNMFLSSSRDPFRKWHEIVLTFFMERHLSKRRILELYLNAAEFGKGIYGVEAAARHYWGVSAAELTQDQSLELASTLPAPTKHNPETKTAFFIHHKQKLAHHLDIDLSPIQETTSNDPEARNASIPLPVAGETSPASPAPVSQQETIAVPSSDAQHILDIPPTTTAGQN